MLACQWKRDIQRHLHMVDCNEVQKQMLATFRLVGAALQWWESITIVEERDTLDITEFWVWFGRKYFPPAVETEMRRKFREVTQGDRSMADYEEEFTRLANFVPDEVSDEERKKERFMDGLVWRIRQHLVGNPALVSYTDVVNAALLHCQEYRFHVKGGRKGVEANQSDKEGGNTTSAVSQQQTGGDYGQDFRKGNYAKRFRAGGYRHDGQQGWDQWQGEFNRRCFVSGEAGHMKRDCPKRGMGQLEDEVLDVQPLQEVMGAFGQGEDAPESEDQPLQLEYGGNYFYPWSWGIFLSDKEDVTI